MAKKPEEAAEVVAQAASAPVMYVFPVDIDVVGPTSLIYSFKGGVPRELPESVVPAAVAAGVQVAT